MLASEALEKAKEKQKTQKQEREAYFATYKERARTLRRAGEALFAVAKKAAGRRGRRKKEDEPEKLKLPPGELTTAQLSHLRPPNSGLWRGNLQRRWNGHCPPFMRVSASWDLFGHRSAAVLVLRDIWQQRLFLEGKDVTECPVEGLF